MIRIQARRGGKRSVGALMLAVVLVMALGATPAAAQRAEERSAGSQYVVGLGSLLVTPIYGAAKLAFATVGVIVGGFTWIFTGGDGETAAKVWDTTLKGNYVISSEHLAGDRPIRFIGGS